MGKVKVFETDRQRDGQTDEWDLTSPRFRESGGQQCSFGQKERNRNNGTEYPFCFMFKNLKKKNFVSFFIFIFCLLTFFNQNKTNMILPKIHSKIWWKFCFFLFSSDHFINKRQGHLILHSCRIVYVPTLSSMRLVSGKGLILPPLFHGHWCYECPAEDTWVSGGGPDVATVRCSGPSETCHGHYLLIIFVCPWLPIFIYLIENKYCNMLVNSTANI